LTDFHQIDELLEMLAPPKLITPSSLPLDHGVTFVGREKELQQIKESILQSNGGVQMISGHLFSLDGAGGVGKTTLAIEVAKQCAAHFKHGVLPPIRVDEHNPISFVMQLAAEFNLKDVEEPPDKETAKRLVTAILKDRQALLILDNAVKWQNLRYMLPFQTKSTILITTRNRDIFRHLRLHCRENMPVEEVSLEIFSEPEALQLFREMLNSDYHGKEKDTYLKIAATLGFLPLALRQVISLILFGPHYTAERLLEKLENEDRLALLKKGHAAEGSDSRTIETVFDLSPDLLTKELTETMEYLAVCAPGPVPLAFLQQLIQNEAIDEHLEQLHSFSWCDRRELDGERFYELHQLVRELVHKRFNKRFSKDFIETVHQIFTNENIHFTEKESLFTQLNEALIQAVETRDERLTDWLYDLYDFCSYRGYFDFYVRLTEHVEKLYPEDKWSLRTAYAHRALILKAWGQLEEAMASHRKEEKIKGELGDRAGLAACYGNQAGIFYLKGDFRNAIELYKKQEEISNELGDRYQQSQSYAGQALILKAWGQLEEAMALHRKEEKIKDELGDRAGLARSYGNQALILKAWGQLEEAMALHRKEEQIKDELGDRVGLARSYGNQALILSAWGQLEESMALHRKEEKIKDELGDRAGMAACYGNQALILSAWGQLEESMALHKKQEKIYKELGNQAGLALSYSGQGLILAAQGKLKEALDYYKKEEKICGELGDRAGLARTWWNQGIIYGEKGDKKKQIELWRKSIEMNKAIGIPTTEDEKALEELIKE